MLSDGSLVSFNSWEMCIRPWCWGVFIIQIQPVFQEACSQTTSALMQIQPPSPETDHQLRLELRDWRSDSNCWQQKIQQMLSHSVSLVFVDFCTHFLNRWSSPSILPSVAQHPSHRHQHRPLTENSHHPSTVSNKEWRGEWLSRPWELLPARGTTGGEKWTQIS